MRIYIKQGLAVSVSLLALGCSNTTTQSFPDVTIYTIVTVDAHTPSAKAVAVKDGKIVGLGSTETLVAQYSGSTLDETFSDQIIIPGLIDPHVHMILGAMMYSQHMAPPWDVQSPTGDIKGLPDPESFIAGVTKLVNDNPGDNAILIYGYHNLVQGDVDRHDLDAITSSRPLILWHYSGHDYYMNTKALESFMASILAKTDNPTGVSMKMHCKNSFQRLVPCFSTPYPFKEGLTALKICWPLMASLRLPN